MPRRSPIWLVKKRPFGDKGPTFHVWDCDENRLRIARFVSRRHPEVTVLVHPSTKKGAKWQVSYFENEIPTGDMQEQTCQLALRPLNRKSYRLAEVIGSEPDAGLRGTRPSRRPRGR